MSYSSQSSNSSGVRGLAPPTNWSGRYLSAPRVPEPDFTGDEDSYERRAYEVLRQLAGGRLPTVQVPEPLKDAPLEQVLFMQLRMYMHERGIEDNELMRILNAQASAFDRSNSRFRVSAGLHYSI